jgi:hypothetical protein
MTRPPPIPEEQRAPGGPEQQASETEGLEDRRDRETGVQTGQPGDAGVNTDTQGRFGNLTQNLTTQWKTQAR